MRKWSSYKVWVNFHPKRTGRKFYSDVRWRLSHSVSTTSSFTVQHPSFETAQLTLTYNKQLTNFCIFRPPSGKKNKFSDSMFLDQFSGFLEHFDSLPGKTLLVGDFNFHFVKT